MSATGISKEIIFLRGRNTEGDFGIEYLCTPVENVSPQDVESGDGWYFLSCIRSMITKIK